MARDDQTSKTTETATLYLYMALELSAKIWRLAFSIGGKIRQTTIPAGDEELLRRRIETAKQKAGLPPEARVVSCYEAGRDGFWVHRFLTKLGIENVVVDPASMRVNRRRRRAKNDRIDARQLVVDLMRHHQGEREVWSAARIPTEEQEDNRQLHRGLERLKKERKQLRGRILSLLATQGVRVESLSQLMRHLDAVRIWNGQPLPRGLRAEIERVGERLVRVEQQIRTMAKEQAVRVKEPATDELKKIERMMMLRGIGLDSAWLLVMEVFGWREFSNRREVGGMAGLGGTPYSSGETDREQGISKAGSPMVRTRLVELAWQWLKHQPQSELSQWYMRRFALGGKRLRRIGIVAMARRLVVDVWRFVEHGVTPRGALLKNLSATR